MSLPVTENATGEPLGSGQVRCTATIAGKKVRSGSTLGHGVATCRFQIPAGTKGKTITGSIAVVFQGESVKRKFSSAIR